MRISVEIRSEELIRLRKFFKNYGTIQPLLTQSGMHRMTLNRLLTTGRATLETIKKVRTYIAEQEKLINEIK